MLVGKPEENIIIQRIATEAQLRENERLTAEFVRLTGVNAQLRTKPFGQAVEYDQWMRKSSMATANWMWRQRLQQQHQLHLQLAWQKQQLEPIYLKSSLNDEDETSSCEGRSFGSVTTTAPSSPELGITSTCLEPPGLDPLMQQEQFLVEPPPGLPAPWDAETNFASWKQPEQRPSSRREFKEGEQTAVMMRNVPNNYSRLMLLQLLHREGFRTGTDFNLVYLPMDFGTSSGLGYCFVNFATQESVERFWNHFDGFNDWGMKSEKVCRVSWSESLQGLEAHIERYRNSPVMHKAVAEEFRPMLFNEQGKRVDFPPPTRRLRPPPLR